MSVTFTVQSRVAGWRSGCPFDPTVYPTFDAAATAAATHPVGGCEPAQRWRNPVDLDDAAHRAWWDRYNTETAQLGQFPDWCVDGPLHPNAVYDDEPPALNVSQSHGAQLLRVLGYVDTDGQTIWGGAEPAEAFLGRVAVAQAFTANDAGIPASTHTKPGAATVIDGGRRAGYLDDKLAELADLARWATEHRSDPMILWS